MEEAKDRSLEVTPTWAVAIVCSIFVLASFGLERSIHFTGKWLQQREERSRSKPLYQALEKIKEELMLLGFVSLLLASFGDGVTRICRSPTRRMIPCEETEAEVDEISRFNCPEGKVPFISKSSLHKLHIFIFLLAIVHVVYSCFTLLLGRYKVHCWGVWEIEAQRSEEETALPRLNRQRTFLHKHAKPRYMSSPFLSWIVCFARQFGSSVTQTEYTALRVGFLQKHRLRPTFDFHRYILRVLHDDYRDVVGISGPLWLFVVTFLLLDIKGWNTYFWISFLPLGLLLVIGAKLQYVIMSLAGEVVRQQHDEEATANLRDDLFWFKRPQLVLHLLHFILFQNAFELAFFLWIWRTLGFTSCLMERLGFVITRLVIGIIVQVLCSYSTLPLYALVTQMGSHYKAAIFNEHVQHALSSWHAQARHRAKHHPSIQNSDASQPHSHDQAEEVELNPSNTTSSE
ncbi:MLO-like protein 13 isoform X1 [Selaginella moellendorffii]|uniref:MLO-like protein 13 isoform X1 n=1 Tax=Selaginella moellendorffii TaxID=88036 RepID=UPI000D1C32BB|nr:MLO-like protein 13 isoform X1 [Selaginella moellendorffii]XP_024528353.1 MLO-like protein 13 isoform X1 [Selaginella moellendorffii]|eukprot:XP_024528352.1 MLO-like protein 13 isoform X1 [Selaginella moellendorffii]